MSTEDLNITACEEVHEALPRDALREKIASARSKFPSSPLFLLFTGAKKEDGRSWCPDCTRAAPVIFTALEEYAPDSVLLIFNCVREEYKDSSFTYRVNEDIQLNSVPTFISWSDEKGVVGRLGDADSQNASLVKKLVQGALNHDK